MIANSINPRSATPSVGLADPQESLVQITLKLKNMFYVVSL